MEWATLWERGKTLHVKKALITTFISCRCIQRTSRKQTHLLEHYLHIQWSVQYCCQRSAVQKSQTAYQKQQHMPICPWSHVWSWLVCTIHTWLVIMTLMFHESHRHCKSKISMEPFGFPCYSFLKGHVEEQHKYLYIEIGRTIIHHVTGSVYNPQYTTLHINV